MPTDALSIALAASIYPPALAAVIALGRGSDVRTRVLIFVTAALLTVYVVGAIVLILFSGLSLSTSSSQHSIGAGIGIALGVLALGAAWWLWRPSAERERKREEKKQAKPAGPSRTERYMENRRLILVLGFSLYVIPSPVYLGAVKSVADTNASTTVQLGYLAIVVLVMLWLIEVPMLVLLFAPERGAQLLERINAWFGRRGRLLGVLALAGAGLYLIGHGLSELLS